MVKKLSLILLIIQFSFLSLVQGQNRTTTKLNRHFIEIEETDSTNHHFNKVEIDSPTGEKVTWIFDLQNRMVQQSKIGVHPTENFNQEIIETFNSTNQLTSQKIYNLDNRKYISFYYQNGVKKAQVIYHGNEVFEIWRNNPDSLYTSDYNDFGPGLDRKVWNSFLAKNLRYPSEARKVRAEGTVIIALLVSENGDIKDAEIANEEFVNSDLAEEALRVVKLFKGKFTPAKNIKGEPEEIWFNLPIRFQLG